MGEEIKVNDYTCNYEVIENSNGWKIVRTSCSCLSDDHILGIEVEKDKDFGTTLIFNYELVSKDYIDMACVRLDHSDSIGKKFILRMWGKIKLICKIIFNRPINFEEAFIFRGRKHVDDVCDYIKKVAQEVEDERD